MIVSTGTALTAITTALVAVYLGATPAAAAEIMRRPQANGPAVITIDGVIERGDDKKFIEIARGVNQAIIVLNSIGGYNTAAMKIGSLIRVRNYDTSLKAVPCAIPPAP